MIKFDENGESSLQDYSDNENHGIICGEDQEEIVLNMQMLKDGEPEIISKTIQKK